MDYFAKTPEKNVDSSVIVQHELKILNCLNFNIVVSTLNNFIILVASEWDKYVSHVQKHHDLVFRYPTVASLNLMSEYVQLGDCLCLSIEHYN